jgi:hypothetical protein
MSLADDVQGIFGSLSNGTQAISTTISNALGTTPPNSAPAPSMETAGVGNTAASANVEPRDNTIIYLGVGAVVIIAVILLVRK